MRERKREVKGDFAPPLNFFFEQYSIARAPRLRSPIVKSKKLAAGALFTHMVIAQGR